MLNKYMKMILPMLETVEEALGFLTERSFNGGGQIIGGVRQAINSIVNAVELNANGPEKDAVTSAGKNLSKSLTRRVKDNKWHEVKNDFADFKKAVEDIPVQKKVLFLPNYGNTWDSLESVYFAFNGDPAFETDVVIVPVYRNTPDGLKLIYSDYLTPMGVPNTGYEFYDVTKDLPDIVFYNNPYDALYPANYTSIFLKSYADCLVYVPYFTFHHHSELEGKQLEDGIRLHTQLSGHNNADVIIAQGETFMKVLGSKSTNANKMAVLGSPKTDYLLNHKKNNDWPRYADWEQKMNGKKVFLFNTHYQTVELRWCHRWSKYIADFFTEDEESILIWRPHPQTFFMTDSLEEDLSESLKVLMSKMEGSDHIIIDKTPFAVSSLMYCDAVLSPSSSIVSMATCLDLPVFYLEGNPKEFSPQGIEGLLLPEYDQLLEAAKVFNEEELTSVYAYPHFGQKNYAKSREEVFGMRIVEPLTSFINAVKNNEKPQADLQKKYRRQLFNNCDGTCAQHILEYIKKL